MLFQDYILLLLLLRHPLLPRHLKKHFSLHIDLPAPLAAVFTIDPAASSEILGSFVQLIGAFERVLRSVEVFLLVFDLNVSVVGIFVLVRY